jgi:hypothetical protein
LNLLFTTQSASLDMFEALRAALAERLPLGRCGFTIADSAYYLRWSREHSGFERAGHALLKEWDVTAVRAGPPDRALLARYEETLGRPGLFGAIVADRRLIMGPDCTYRQDYRRRFSDDELLRILQEAVVAVDRLFDEVRPDAVVGFICVTILEHLVHLFARARGVPVLNLRPTRIGNRVMYGSTLTDPAPELVAAYERIRRSGSPRLDEARAHIASVRVRHGKYEGVVAPSAAPAQKAAVRGNPLGAALRLWRAHREYRASIAARDNHVPGILRPLLFKAVLNPLRARRVRSELGPRYVRPGDLAGVRFAFLPLHTEPEVSLLVYSRPWLNQIEAVRAFAHALPADMMLVVKEHPWMVGKRSLGAYRKLLEIPRVLLAPPETDARAWIEASSLIATISSSVALEAAMLGRPAVSLGHGPFNLLPPGMVRRCADPHLLPETIAAALAEHRPDEAALEAYVAAILEISVGVNLYSNLLGRQGAHADEARAFDADIALLADYTAERLRQHLPAAPAPVLAAP